MCQEIKEIKQRSYYKPKSIGLTIQELNFIKSDVKINNLVLDHKTTVFHLFDKYGLQKLTLEIVKDNDDYYYVQITDDQRKKPMIYFKCDQIDSMKKLIEMTFSYLKLKDNKEITVSKLKEYITQNEKLN